LLNTVYNKNGEDLPSEIGNLRRKILLFTSYKRIRHSLGYFMIPVHSLSKALVFYTSLFVLFLLFLSEHPEIINVEYISQCVSDFIGIFQK